MLIYRKNDKALFKLLSESAVILKNSAEELRTFANKLGKSEHYLANLAKFKEESNSIIWSISEYTTNSLTTPLDSADILKIAWDTDSLTNDIEKTAHRLSIYNITVMYPEALGLIDRLAAAAQYTEDALSALGKPDWMKVITDRVNEVNRIVNTGSEIHRQAVKKLFENGEDAIHVIKWNELYDRLNKCIDSSGKLAGNFYKAIKEFYL